MNCTCRICKLPNAKDIWDVANKQGKNKAQRLSGLPRATFYSNLKVHASQQSVQALAAAAPGVVGSTAPQPPDQEPLFPQDPKTMEPEEVLWILLKELSTIARSSKATEQVKTTALDRAANIVFGIQKSRSSGADDLVDPSKVDAELQKTLLEKLDTYLPPTPSPSVVLHPAPSPSGVEAGLVH